MSPLLLLYVACLSLVFFIFYCIIQNRRLPVNWPLVGILPSLLANLDSLHDYLTTLLREARGTMAFQGPGSLGTQFLLTCDPADVNHILHLRFQNYPKGLDFKEMFDLLGDGIISADGELWTTQRKMAHAVMRERTFPSSMAAMSEAKVEKALFPFLDRMAESGEAFDLQDVMLRFTFDAASELVLGVNPGALAPGLPTVPFSRAIDEAEETVLFRHLVPSAWWKLMRKLDVGEEKKLRVAGQVIDQFIAQIIKERRDCNNTTSTTTTGSKDVHANMLRSYMDLAVQEEGYYGSDKFLRDTVLTFMIAGKDTTGSVLTWFFWLVSQNPRVEAKILQDLTRESSSDTGESVYLHASLCEALRLYPPLPINHKRSLQSDVLPSGHKISGGTEILISMYSMGRMEAIWGKDCLEFRPERWITEKGKLRYEPPYKFSAFSSGPRICLGKDVAFVQMKTVAAALISNFHIQVVEGHVVKPKLTIALQMKNGLMVRVTKRRDGSRHLM